MLRSPSKFWGIAATRVGVAWCADPRAPVRAARPPRDVADLGSGRRGRRGRDGERRRGPSARACDLAADAAWLAGRLRELPGTLVERDVGVHYRCLITDAGGEIAAAHGEHGVGVRTLGRAHGVEPGALRVLAPLPHQRDAVAPRRCVPRAAPRCAAAGRRAARRPRRAPAAGAAR